jgi:Autographiviridae endonuclease VII
VIVVDKTRYAEDAEYRARMLEGHRAYYQANKETINARERLRYTTDADFRERKLGWVRKSRRRLRLKNRFGISLEDYDALLAKQNGACAICKKKSARSLCVDHCHATGMIRGLLCKKCNSSMGFFEDDAARIRAAIAYLKASRAAHLAYATPTPAHSGLSKTPGTRYPAFTPANQTDVCPPAKGLSMLQWVTQFLTARTIWRRP